MPTSTFAAPPIVVPVVFVILALRRWAGGVAAAPVAAPAEDAEEADLPGIKLCLRRRALLGLLHLDDADRVALVVPSSFLIDDDIVIFIVSLDYLSAGNEWSSLVRVAISDKRQTHFEML